MAKLSLNDHLFEVLENLTDKTVKGEELEEQLNRAHAVTKIAQQIIASNNLILRTTVAALDAGIMIPEAKSKLKLIVS
jgi:hypothetical protein